MGRILEIDFIIGENIKSLRKEKKLSQTELAKMVGVSFQQIQKYEKGINRVSAARLLIISEILNVPITYFYIKENKHS